MSKLKKRIRPESLTRKMVKITIKKKKKNSERKSQKIKAFRNLHLALFSAVEMSCKGSSK